ncbi:conserved protein of unknown function [Bradyrhizobium sp. ORS 285]|uniref:major capsid protein n=1 Tax=Bradyrhizobium sp. ORS 285 TaxID=115808 RepID=UPI000240958A|nr:major capsid protein [Bradyrhizobium sp. ORS 285]CCD89838.1 conserved hypothetical protein [Bradyrhizobium sp. ORS 285]SMX61532.1 conserved protein of unknown function [Bradyrhizobium sp. ORS 285]
MADTNRYLGVDPILTDISLGYQNADYIADLLLPTVPVGVQSGKHFVYDKGKFRSLDSRRGAGARSKEVTLNLTPGLTFFCEDHAAKQFVPDEDVKNAHAGMDPYVDATENVTEMMLVEKEVNAASLLLNTSNITQNTTLSGTSQWSDDNSDPIRDVRTAKNVIRSSVIQVPNTLMLSQSVRDKLIDHPAIIDRFKYVQGGIITNEMLARAFDVDRVIIGAAQKNTAVEGQSDSMSDIWGKNALLCYINPRRGQKIVTLGVTYQWQTPVVERLQGVDEIDRRGQFIRRGEDYRDMELVAPGSAYLFANAIA